MITMVLTLIVTPAMLIFGENISANRRARKEKRAAKRAARRGAVPAE